MTLEEALLKKRPSLSKSSVKTYTSVLKSFYKRMYGNDTPIKMDNFNKQEEILKNLQNKSPTTRKTILSALAVLTNNDTYREEMLKDIKQHQEMIDNQQMSKKQMKNGVSQEDIGKKLKELKKYAMSSLRKVQTYQKQIM